MVDRERAAQDIPREGGRIQALSDSAAAATLVAEIADALARAGQLTNALAAPDSIEISSRRDLALFDMLERVRGQ